MKSQLKQLIENWIPPIISKAMYRLYNDFLFRRYPNKIILKKNICLKNKGVGKRAFLLATGPSLKHEDLSKLVGEDCFSLSNFFLHHQLALVNPAFHFFAPYHPPLILENYVDWLRLADQKLPSQTKIVLGHSIYELVKKYNLFLAREVFYLYFSGFPDTNSVNIMRPVLAPQTSPLMILPVLIYMGYEKIYLLGCDHTVLKDYKNDFKNFYEKERDIRKNAIDVNAWGDIITEHEASMRTLLQYQFYKKIMNTKHNSQIINLSNDSWVEIFERDRLANVLTKL